MTNFDRWLDEMTAEVAGIIYPDNPCDECEGGGFVFSSYQAGPGAPYLEVCQKCGNPEGLLPPWLTIKRITP